jgi:hypothetical protein
MCCNLQRSLIQYVRQILLLTGTYCHFLSYTDGQNVIKYKMYNVNIPCIVKRIVGVTIIMPISSCSRLWVWAPSGWVKPKTVKLVFVTSPLRTQYWWIRAKSGWLKIRIMFSSGATYFFSLRLHYANPN